MSDDLIDKELLSGFFEEARDRTDSIEKGLLKLEQAKIKADRKELALSLMRTAHSLKGASGFVEMREIESACHWMEDIFEAVSNGRIGYCPPILESLFSVNDAIYKFASDALASEADEAIVTDALAKAKTIVCDEVQKKSDTKRVTGSQPQPPQNLETDLRATKPVVAAPSHESIRIPLSKLDSLLYRSEELLKSRGRLLKRSNDALELYDLIIEHGMIPSKKELGQRILHKISSLADDLADDRRLFETATYYLEHEVRRARMQSFKEACVGLARVVRDACLKSGKQAELAIDGDNVEIDQSIVTGMNDILRHLVRNAIDHGIESTEERNAAGKGPVGQIKIVARTVGDRLSVQVSDDGRGVPILREMSNKRRYGGGFSELEERSALQELFRPGYTTATSVTELSGRGLGLDIVKRTVERQRGYLEVSLNEKGGSTFSIVLPLSLTVTRGLMIRVADQYFAIETATARRLERLTSSVIHREGNKLVIEYYGRLVPAMFIDEWLFGRRRDDNASDEFEAVMIGDDDNEIAVIVNKVIGEQELVIRPLGARISGNRKYNGAATLANGNMVLILNPVALIDGALGVADSAPKPMHRVLVVDDSPTVRNAHKRHLEEHGFEVDVTVNGSEAWDRLQTTKPDVIVADVDMPLMDGLSLAEAVRSSKDLGDIPIILVTSRTSKSDLNRSKKAKVNAYIVKNSPQHEQLANTVSNLLTN